MPKIRKGTAYRRLERPYTRISKFKKKSYIRTNPNIKIVRFDMGNLKKKFNSTLKLVSKEGLQVRDNSLESARMTANRVLELNLGPNGYHMKLRTYPHHVLRENPLAAGAGADRFSTGMQKAFGKPIGNAARIKKNQTVFEVNIDKSNIAFAKKALERALKKIPGSYRIERG